MSYFSLLDFLKPNQLLLGRRENKQLCLCNWSRCSSVKPNVQLCTCASAGAIEHYSIWLVVVVHLKKLLCTIATILFAFLQIESWDRLLEVK